MAAYQFLAAYQCAKEEADIAEEAEAAARLKRVKARRAVEAAEKDYDQKFDAYHRALRKSQDAYRAWQEASAAEAGKAGA